jgi:hypothetical protein
MTTINGLPAHVLLAHAIVVLLPLSAVLLVLTALWAPARRRLAGPNALLRSWSSRWCRSPPAPVNGWSIVLRQPS